IISSFVQDIKKAADIPLPRHRSEEIEKVLRLINNLIESLKSSCTDHRKEKRNLHNSEDYFSTQSLSSPAVDECQKRRQYNRRILNKLYALYPLLVDIVPCNNRPIREELVRTLKNFALFFG
uniref:BHLH domain-containing protein n=1 Tax=Romanomermis culicivorax TaxID=13658 RepID=A0A915HIX2_ROMCU